DIVFNEWGCEHYGRVNWMKGALNYSDKIVAVSPKYANEILTEEFGEGMDYTLRGHTNKLVGILNGIDYDVFNPATDKNLVKNYDEDSLKGKDANKKAICEYFGLEYNPERPLIAMISRLVSQKGVDLIRQVENDLKHLEADFVFLGSGDSSYENLLIWLSNNTSNIRSYIGYQAELANKIYAGSDFFLMPSKFEPCGLSQLIAMRYGSLPIVRATGGLDDTVTGYPLDNSNGFKFWGYDGWQMKEAINCAIGVYRDRYTFNAMRKSAMASDFTWKKSAEEYLKLYKSLV
ncbi:glycogen/starch synthase, partial [bacterium]|nr:glycogen/starch synthase [bacterium]